MEFKELNSLEQLEEIDLKSKSKLQAIFKHSTSCGTSNYVKKNILKEMGSFSDEPFDIYYLDLLALRNVSNSIADRYGIRHESPQLLIIKDGQCIAHNSHSEVTLELDWDEFMLN